jgi:HemY protein
MIMVRVFLFTVQIILLIAAGYWIFNHPGSVSIHWLGYDIEAHIGVAFVALVTIVFTLLFLYKVIGWVAALPRRLMGLRGRKRRGRGFQSLTIGLSAVAAGDSRLASYHAYRMRQFLPDEKGLPWLLEAQAAKLRGEDGEAKMFFEKLLKDKDTAFMGVRGLLTAAIDSADVDSALELARQALVMHPAQSWIIRTVFGLEVQKREWAAALTTLKKGERAKAWTPEEIKSNRVAILLQQGEELHRGGYQGEATRKYKDAHRLDPSFTPAALALAQDYFSHQKRRAAVAVIERSWKEKPHPDLVPVWESLSPHNKPNDVTAHLRWFERLVALNPGSAESQIAAARAAIHDGMWGEAWQYLTAAEKIRPDARLYRMWAQMEEKTDHSESAKRYWEKAADAAPDQVWWCNETGRIYERWMPIADPHGAFNTIIWGYPHARDAAAQVRLAGANDIVIEPVLSIASKI